MNGIKKIGAAVVAAVLCLSLFSGCDKSEIVPPASTDTQAQEKGFKASDLDVVVNGKTLKLGDKEASIKEVFGEPNEIYEAESCLFDGFDKTYFYDFCEIFTFPAEDGSGNIVDEIYFYSENAPLVCRGELTVGATKAEVCELFGDKYYMDGESMMVYNAENNAEKNESIPKLYFYLEEGVVAGIGYCANMYHPEA